MKAIKSLRENGIKCEFYPDLAVSNKQQKKQWKYISNRSIEYVVTKVDQDLFTVKNMFSNEQSDCSIATLIEKLK